MILLSGETPAKRQTDENLLGRRYWTLKDCHTAVVFTWELSETIRAMFVHRLIENKHFKLTC